MVSEIEPQRAVTLATFANAYHTFCPGPRCKYSCPECDAHVYHSRHFLEWVGAQNAIAADAAATADLHLAARFERVEHDLTIRLVEGTASAADKLFVPALVARDQILGPMTTWCPWWWRSASYIPELRTHVTQLQPATRAPRVSRSAEAQHDMRNTETYEALQQANAFITAEEEYLPLPQMDGTDVTSADPQCDALPSITTLRWHTRLLWLPGTLPWLGVQRITARCAHVNPLRPFCDSTKFPQKPAATRIAVTGAAACAA